MTAETADRLGWIYEVAYHARYLRASDDHGVIHRAGALGERTDAQIIADWRLALDALFFHGLECTVPRGADPAPLDFHGAGRAPVFKILEQRGTATIDVVSAEIAEAATGRITPASRGRRWAAWTARHGDPTAAFLRLAAEFGVVTVDGAAVSLTPLGIWAVAGELEAEREVLPPSAELTPRQLVICRLGMSDGAFGRELAGWLAARSPPRTRPATCT